MKNSRHSGSVIVDVLSQLLRTLIAFFVTVDFIFFSCPEL